MDDDLHDIDRLFYDALGRKQELPSEKVWEKIEAGLDENANKKRFAYLNPKRLLLLAAVLIFGTLGVIRYTQSNNNEADYKTDTTVLRIQPIDNKDQIALQRKTKNSMDATSSRKTQSISADTNNNIEKEQIARESKPNKTQYKVAVNHDKKPVNKIDNNDTQKGISNKGNDISASRSNTVNDRKITDKNVLSNKDFKANIEGNLNGKRLVIGISNKETGTAKNGQKRKGQTNLEERNTLLQSAIGTNFTIFPQSAFYTVSMPSGLLGTQNPLLLLSQTKPDNTSPKKTKTNPSLKKSHFYLSVFAAQEWQGYALQDNDDNVAQQTGNDRNSIKHREDEDPSPAAGMNIGYQLGKKFSLETGIRFGGYHIRSDSAKIYAVSNSGDVQYKLTTSSGYAYLQGIGGNLPMVGDSTIAQKVKQTISYIGVPILLRYKIGKGKLSFNPALGVVFNFITKSTVSANLNNGQSKVMQSVSLRGLRNFSAMAMVNPSIYYQVSNKISVGVEPYASYSISPINNTNVVKSYPYGLGLGAGVKYSF